MSGLARGRRAGRGGGAAPGCRSGRALLPGPPRLQRGRVGRGPARGGRAGARLLVSAKDAVRLPRRRRRAAALVLEIEWEWLDGDVAPEELVARAPRRRRRDDEHADRGTGRRRAGARQRHRRAVPGPARRRARARSRSSPRSRTPSRTPTTRRAASRRCSRARDSFDLHVRDTLRVAAPACAIRTVVRAVVREGPARLRELIALGVRFTDATASGLSSSGARAATRRRRIVHAGDFTGREIERALLAAARRHPNVTLLENHLAVDLLLESTAPAGGARAAAPPRPRGVGRLRARPRERPRARPSAPAPPCSPPAAPARSTSTRANPDIATGDGVAMAYRAGAAVANLEFVQFHPTCLYHPRAKSFLITEAVRGEGAVLHALDGTRFMPRVAPAGRPRAARRRGAGDRPRDEAPRRRARAARPAAIGARAHRASASRTSDRRCRELGIDLTARADPGGAGRALPVRRRASPTSTARTDLAAALRGRRGGLHRAARREPPGLATRCSRRVVVARARGRRSARGRARRDGAPPAAPAWRRTRARGRRSRPSVSTTTGTRCAA